jgi:hypothetical protein
MKVNAFDGSQYEANPTNSIVLCYENDMMNGLYIDMDDDYAFVSADEEFYPELALTAVHEGILVVDVESFDAEDAPHCWVINALVRATIQTAEDICECE